MKKLTTLSFSLLTIALAFAGSSCNEAHSKDDKDKEHGHGHAENSQRNLIFLSLAWTRGIGHSHEGATFALRGPAQIFGSGRQFFR